MDVKGKVALITGGASGLGKAAAVLLAAHGAQVGVLSRTEAQVNQTVEEIRTAGGAAFPLIADIARSDEIRAATDNLVEQYGRLDIVFANAGINGVWAPIEEITDDEWQTTMNVNLNGTFYTIRAAVPHLRAAGGGSIIVNASVNGTRIFSNTGATAYSATKAGQVAMTKMLALELAKHNIRVNVICPGAIESEIRDNTTLRNIDQVREPVTFHSGRIPLTRGKSGKAEQVGQLVMFLASDWSSHITGTEVWIDGGESLLQG
jgi:NAD(P)-dependent dehydrogenase (short-subunit alcohol dehydrogenase family)